MLSFLKDLGNLYLYSSLHIAICAGLLTMETYVVLNQTINSYVILFMTMSTMAVYSLHRIVGMSKVSDFDDQGRYKVIKKYRNHIIIYFILSALVCSYLVFQLDFQQCLVLSTPIFITLLYVVPILTRQRRLRDLPYVKIFIIAIIWAVLTIFIVLPNLTPLIWLLLIERILFFVAITIPFDIRDASVDQAIGVKTLIHYYGVMKSRWLAIFLLCVNASLLLITFLNNYIELEYMIALFLSYLYSSVLIYFSDIKKGDWFFGGLLDASIGLRMIIFFIVIQIAQS